MVSLENRDRVAVVKLDRGVTNALDLRCVRELAKVMERVQNDTSVRSLVLASVGEKFFSIGFDIPQLFELGEDEFGHFYRAFNQVCLDLYSFPKPTVAAITGHAIAGGCILALCCDYRLIAAGRKLMGLNEIKLGVPIPYLADCVLRQLVGLGAAREIADLGEFFRPEDSLKLGLVDAILPAEEVLEKAIERAERLGSLPAAAFGLIKRNRVEGVRELVLERRDDRERAFVESWFSPPTRERLRLAMEKF